MVQENHNQKKSFWNRNFGWRGCFFPSSNPHFIFCPNLNPLEQQRILSTQTIRMYLLPHESSFRTLKTLGIVCNMGIPSSFSKLNQNFHLIIKSLGIQSFYYFLCSITLTPSPQKNVFCIIKVSKTWKLLTH